MMEEKLEDILPPVSCDPMHRLLRISSGARFHHQTLKRFPSWKKWALQSYQFFMKRGAFDNPGYELLVISQLGSVDESRNQNFISHRVPPEQIHQSIKVSPGTPICDVVFRFTYSTRKIDAGSLHHVCSETVQQLLFSIGMALFVGCFPLDY